MSVRIVPYTEKVAVQCPAGTLDRVKAVALSLEKRPSEVLREAVMNIARQGDAIREEKAA
jgi:hypothetical protein